MPSYTRINVDGLARQGTGEAGQGLATPLAPQHAVRWVILPVSLLLCITQAVLCIIASNVRGVILTSTLIPVLAFAVLFAAVLAVNPLLRLLYVGRLGPRGLGWTVTARNSAGWLTFAAGGAALALLAWGWTDQGSARGVAVWLLVLAAAGAGLCVLLAIVTARGLSRSELMCIFAAMLVTSGVSTFGLTAQLVPLVAAPRNPEWNTPQRGWDQLLPSMNSRLYLQDTGAIQAFREGVKVDTQGRALSAPPDSAPWKDHVQYYGRVTAAIPWGAWLPPLGYWMIFVAAWYGVFYALTHTVLPFWSTREKLIFPLVKLPESLLPAAGDDGGQPGRRVLPRILSTPGFWAGFAVSFAVLSWNALTRGGFLPGLPGISLGMNHYAVNGILQGSFLEGLTGSPHYNLTFLVIFTAIGIAFLLPVEISFSIWFYFVVAKLVLLVGVWLGYGQRSSDFTNDWLWESSPVTALGGGALLTFSVIMLWRSVRDHLEVSRRSARGPLRIGGPLIGLVVGLSAVTAWLLWNGVGVGWALLLVTVMTLMTLGVMRIVAEGGVYWFQWYFGPFHVYRMLGLGRWLAPALLGPLLPIMSVLFLDPKTMLAPNLLNAAKLEKDDGRSRSRFHVNLLVCLAVTVVVSVAFELVLAHVRSGQQMHNWFYNQSPPMLLDKAVTAVRTPPHFEPVTTGWFAAGAGWLVLSIVLRRWLFWFPHPIGFTMLVNPLMTYLWFSFFIGWLAKRMVVRYGGKATFDRTRGVFIGLIMGELIAVSLWPILSLIFSFPVPGIDLNRYGS